MKIDHRKLSILCLLTILAWLAPGDVAFRVYGAHEVDFDIGTYAPALPLVMGTVTTWNTFMGSIGIDEGYAIAVDSAGNIYVTGVSWAAWGAPINPYAGLTDAFVAKLDSGGNLQWHTFLGTTGVDVGEGIAVDSGGNVYVVGTSRGTWGAPLNAYAGRGDAFVARLDRNGILQWNTFIGAANTDEGKAIAVDGAGNSYITGNSQTSWGTPLIPHAGGDDAFAAKLNSSGILQWSTFMGSASGDFGKDITVDGAGNAYVVGTSQDAWGSWSYMGGDDAFAVKLDSGGSLRWHTFLGSPSGDAGAGIAVDNAGNVYVVGTSQASWGMPVAPHAGGDDAFVTKLDHMGVFLWNTFLGSAGADVGGGIALNGAEVYVTGWSNAAWGAPDNAHAGSWDAFAVNLSSSGVWRWNTFVGSADVDTGPGIALAGSDAIYVVGKSAAAWGIPVSPYVGDDDAFVVRLEQLPAPPAPPPSTPSQPSPAASEVPEAGTLILIGSGLATLMGYIRAKRG